MNTKQKIYGWHIIHAETGAPYAFCCRTFAGQVLEEEDVLDGLNPDEFVLVPLVLAGVVQ